MKQIIFILLLGLSTPVSAQNSSSTRVKQFNLEKTLAIQGYDPVLYFTKNKAVKGSSKFLYKYLGVTYHFFSAVSKKEFESNPEKYEPQFGGWCAYAMGNSGDKVEVDPETFKIIDGKLYLFYNAYFNNTLNSWNKDEKNLKAKANKNWLNIIN